MDLSNFEVNRTEVKKQSWRNFSKISYEYFERNKDKIMNMYNLNEAYNPTDMKNLFMKWCKDNGKPPLTELIHERPIFVSEFLNKLYYF